MTNERTEIVSYLRHRLGGEHGFMWLCKDRGDEEWDDIEAALVAVENGEHLPKEPTQVGPDTDAFGEALPALLGYGDGRTKLRLVESPKATEPTVIDRETFAAVMNAMFTEPTASELIHTLESMRERLAKLESALRFYADARTYCRDDDGVSGIREDGGELAREALR